MSRNNASRSYKIQDLLKQVTNIDEDDLYDLYGVVIDEDGGYFDTCYGKSFKDLHSWVVFNVEMEELEDEEGSAYGSFDDE